MTKLFLALSMIFLFTGQAAAFLKEDVKKGNILYNKKKYAEAVKAYEGALSKDARNGIASFDLGAAKYKEGSYSGAIEKFNTAIASGQPKLVQASDYNIGNVQYRIGNLKEKGYFDEAKERYETALKFYKRAMDLDPGDKDAKLNYEFVEKKLNELAKTYQFKKDEKQKNDKKDKKKDQDQQQDEQQKGENKDNQNKGQSGQQQKDEKDKNQSGGGGQSQEDKQQRQKEDAQNKPEENKDKQAGGSSQKDQKEEQPAPEEQNRPDESQQQNEEKEKSAEPKEGENEKQGGGLEAYQSPEEQEGREMSEQEAKMMLEGYKGEEATGSAVRMRKRVIDLPEPAKDW